METKSSKLRFYVSALLFLAMALGLAMPTQPVLAIPATTIVYDAIPNSLAPNYPSESFEATATSEFGDYVQLTGTNRILRTVTVTMSDWALHSAYPTMPIAGWEHPITLNIYNVVTGGPLNTVGSLLGTVTQTFTIPWRPEDDQVNCPLPDHAWYSGGVCYHGFAFNITFDMNSLNLTLPIDIIVGVAYNTADYGAAPITTPGPYNSLNVGVVTSSPTVGTDDTDRVFLSSTYAGAYNNPVGGTGTFREDTGWTLDGGNVPIQITAVPPPSDVYVNLAWVSVLPGVDPDGAGPASQMGYDAFTIIQDGVNAVASGGTVHVAAGTYTETGQIVINKNLTMVGADKATTIIKPASDTSGSGDAGSWILVNDGITFNLSKVTLDGVGRQIRQAIRYKGSGAVDDIVIQNMASPGYLGWAIAQGFNSTTAMSLAVTNSTFANFGRVGILIDEGAGSSTATISGNTFTCKGDGDHLDYAIEVGSGADATITNNIISNCRGVALRDGSTSAAIYVHTFFAPGTTATITDNTLSDSTVGIAVGYDASDTAVVTAHNNKIYGNSDFGVSTTSTTVTVNAKNNWWGAASGPLDDKTLPGTPNYNNPSGTGNKVSSYVDYSPWCTNAACTTFAPPFATTTTITADTPDPSAVNETVSVTAIVAGLPAGALTPTGTLTFFEGVASSMAANAVGTYCTITLVNGTGSCDMTFLSGGVKTITALYSPANTADFSASSDTESHTVNSAPIITEGASINVTMSASTPFSLTLNATDANSDTITWSVSTAAGHGTASASGTGPSKAIAYTPALNYIGSDSFVVQVSDGNGGTDTITVNVTITAVEPPTFTIFLPLILH